MRPYKVNLANILIFYLVEPTKDAQIPSSRFGGVETDCISREIVVHPYSLWDTIQQLFVWYACIKMKFFADHLRIRKTHVNHREKSWFYVQRDDNGSALLHNKGTNYNFDLQTSKALSVWRCSLCSSSFKVISLWNPPCRFFFFFVESSDLHVKLNGMEFCWSGIYHSQAGIK